MGNVIFHAPFVEKSDLLKGRESEPFDELPQNKLAIGQIAEFRLQGKVFEAELAAFATEDIAPFNDSSTQGNIGVAFLKHFKIVLDYQNRQIELAEKSEIDKR